MRKLVLLVAALLCVPAARAQHPHAAAAPARTATLIPGMGKHHHPIATSNPEAQRFFDQGLTLIFGFNHDEAVRSFERAAQLDPAAPMPQWGIALALGPNYNLDVDPAREKAAYDAAQKAVALAAGAPEHERAYVTALAARYSNAPAPDYKKLRVAYADAMRELMRRYPDDLDAATLYAESLMNLNPWKLWSPEGTAAEGTEEIVAVLEGVLKRDPSHPGANHYYIHAVEASPHPERALTSARRLETLVPAAGHLVHMPAHIYIRTGDYEAASQSNHTAAAVDRAYIEAAGVQGIYPMMYYSHNLHFLAVARSMEGRYAEARRAAQQVAANVQPGVKQMPMLEVFLPTEMFVLVRFNRWEDILKLPAPDASLPLMTAVWRYARGVAYAATGDVPRAEAERQALIAAQAKIPVEATTGFNSLRSLLDLAATIVDARIAAAKGDRRSAIAQWRKAVALQDKLAYTEPPDWYYPTRESLGAALLLDGQAAEAEKVFREDLERTPRNPRSLFGLWESLKAQNRAADADWVRREFERAWQKADLTVRLRLADL